MITIAGYIVDATISEDHMFDAEVTDHPVEQGANVADNGRLHPFDVVLDCIVSDTPIGTVALLRDDGSVPSADTFTFMYNLWTARQPVSISDSLATFDSVVLKSLTIPRSAKEGGALHFKAGFKQVIIVTNSRALVRVSTPSVDSQQNLGNRATTDGAATAKTEGDMQGNQSVADKLVQKLANSQTVQNLLNGG
jgi:hypothetical protein